MQANDGVHLGVDNLGVVRHVGRLLDCKTASLRLLDTVRISKVKGHADAALVRSRCSMESLLGREHASTPQSGVEATRLVKRSLPRLYYCCCFLSQAEK